jgi:hypothetical protein
LTLNLDGEEVIRRNGEIGSTSPDSAKSRCRA